MIIAGINQNIKPKDSVQIFIPYISSDDWGRIMTKYDSFAYYYNCMVNQMRAEGFKHVNTLKVGHRSLFIDLVNQVKGQMHSYRKIFSDTEAHLAISSADSYVLYTNNKEIKKRTGRNESTTWRNIERLIEAGIVNRKIGHGTQADYELHINPEFLIVRDYLESWNENAEKYGFQNTLAANSKPLNTPKNILNNEIIGVSYPELKGVSHSANALQTNTQEQSQEHQKLGEPAVESQQQTSKKIEKEQVPAADSPADLSEKVRLSFSAWLVQYMIKMLFQNHSHYPAVIYNATQYATIYFDGCRTIDEFNNRKNVLKWRVDKAKSFIDRKKFDFKNIYLTDYLDINNKRCGFINTAKWYKSNLELQKKASKRKDIGRIKTDRKKLIDSVNRLDAVFIDGQFTVKDFKREHDYVLRNIPHLEADFMQMTEYIRFNYKLKRTA